ncbi:PfkB family carbohydrate kinase [Bifidobacterium thermacidophilum]|uniref:Sugar kinase n=2 Tax=Bifidobacterium TaxID=1678 RepID=A0A7X9NS04_9BIFI|nr:PfkB family carbohydrate kinase [Bifidobacterium thermophilum]NME62721.1 sugar kinase [Bifidobacterium thermophilum]
MLHDILNSRKPEQSAASVISLGQVWVDIMMGVGELPQPGGFAVADSVTPSVGGSFRVLQAAARSGSPAKHAGIVGTGLWSSVIRDEFEANGIQHIGGDRLDKDSGFRLVLNDGSHKTFIATYGAEAQGDERTFDAIEPEAGDVVHISGNTLMDHSAAGIEGFLHRAGANPEQRPYTIVLNPTNSLHLVSDHLIEDTVLCRPTWSCNRQEANTLAERLGIPPTDDAELTIGGGFDDAMTTLCDALGTTLRAPLVLRAGARGAWVRVPGSEVIHLEGFPVKSTHTRSAGSCHTGVMCAMLAQGWSLFDAVRIANASASIAIHNNKAGVPDCPPVEDAIALIKQHEGDTDTSAQA